MDEPYLFVFQFDRKRYNPVMLTWIELTHPISAQRFFEQVIPFEPFGNFRLVAVENALIGCKRCQEVATPLSKIPQNEILRNTAEQLENYFTGKLRNFELAVAPQGTPFQRSVWQALCKIPYAETRTYKEIAEAIGRSGAYRAVGGANNRNPIAIIIPCHRVIGANGDLIGYAGGLDMKANLLELEKRTATGDPFKFTN